MFCNQCEQAANGTGCNISGVCGKKPDVAALQDHLLFGLKSLALYADRIGRNAEIDRFTIEGLFTTVTNVDFDAPRIGGLIKRCYELKEKARAAAGATISNPVADWKPAEDLAGMIAQGEQHGINTQHVNEDIRSVIEILMYGLKGMAAYMDHAMILGRTDDEVMAFFQKALAATTDSSLGLILPRAAVVADQMAVFFQAGISVSRQHFAMGVDVDPLAFGLLEDLFHHLQVVTGDENCLA